MKFQFSFARYLGLSMHYFRSMKRNPARLIEIIVWPSFELVLFSLLAISVNASQTSFVSAGITILAGVIFWNFTARVVQEIIAQLLDDAFSKNLQNIFITPISLTEFVCGLFTASLIKLCLSLVIMTAILALFAPMFFQVASPALFPLIIQLPLLGLLLSLPALSLVFIFGERASFSGWILSTVAQVFSCVFYERSVLPPVLYELSYLSPASYIFESIRDVISRPNAHAAFTWLPLTLTGVFMLVFLIIFRYSFSYSLRHGTLTKT